ncbi:hypothetical protein QBC44DRAFT_96221 [Cladorrhinum sp. PSN332]|nr:hypothetical protein QBC44DRAFT_96221 [Cladorrhinum sp. PSN332]
MKCETAPIIFLLDFFYFHGLVGFGSVHWVWRKKERLGSLARCFVWLFVCLFVRLSQISWLAFWCFGVWL